MILSRRAINGRTMTARAERSSRLERLLCEGLGRGYEEVERRWSGGKRCGFVESNMRREGEEFTSQAVAGAYLRRGRCLHD